MEKFPKEKKIKKKFGEDSKKYAVWETRR